MNVPQFRTQLQQQHQEAPEGAPAAAAPPVPGAGDDALINDILGDRPAEREAEDEPEPRREREVQEEEEPEPETPEDSADDAAEDDAEDSAEPEPEDDAEEGDAGDLIARARAARDAGDLDEAIRLVFKCKPEELLPNAHVWTKWRAANDKARRGIEAQQRQLDTDVQAARGQLHQERVRIAQTIEALKPYERLRQAELAYERDGDPAQLVALVEGITKKPYAEAQKDILTKTRRSPTERALQERLAALEAQIQQGEQQQQQQRQQLTEQQVYANDLQHIRSNVSGEVTKIPKFAERIYKVLLSTRSAVGLTLTVEQAAARIVAAEKRRIASHPFVRKPKSKPAPPAVSAAARTLAARANKGAARPPLRRDSQNNGARTADDQSTDEIVTEILRGKPARRSA